MVSFCSLGFRLGIVLLLLLWGGLALLRLQWVAAWVGWIGRLSGLMFAFSGVWLINSLQPEEGEGGPKVSPTKKVAGERDGCEDGQEEAEREQGQDHVGKSVTELASGIFLACTRAFPLSLCASRRVRVCGACACPWFCMSHLCVSYRDRTIPGGHASASKGQSHCQESSTIDSAGRGRRRIDDCHEKKDRHQGTQSPAW